MTDMPALDPRLGEAPFDSAAFAKTPCVDSSDLTAFAKTPSALAVRTRTQALLAGLSAKLFEREQAVALSLLTAIAGESIFLLGPPGVGKSLIARRLKHAFADGTSFEYLMSKFSTPDEIFGPVSIKRLKDEDKYERLTDRYLPGANVVFLDEIWKAGPAIQNALLTILNERVYRNGEQEVQVAVRAIISASNELPAPGSSLDPLWDRFLLRLEIDNVRHFESFVRLITDTADVYEVVLPEGVALSTAELDDYSTRIDAVVVSPEALNTIQVLKARIDAYNAERPDPAEHIRVYDRRWKKCVRLLRTSAFLNGRDTVDLMDCFLLELCLWSRPDQREPLREMLAEAVRQHGYAVSVNLPMLRRELDDFERDVDAEIRIRHVVTEDQLQPVQDEYYAILKDDQQFEGQLISVKQFDGLDQEELRVSNLFDQDRNLVNRLKVRKGDRPHTIVVEYNAREFTYRLRTRQHERTEVIAKRPHALLIQHWDDRYRTLVAYINEQLERLKLEAPDALGGLRQNLFVEARFAELAEANQRQTLEAVEGLRLRLDKLRYSYVG